MSSGRDEMLSRWTQEEKKQFMSQKTHKQRMIEYRETLLSQIERLNYHIKELENESEIR